MTEPVSPFFKKPKQDLPPWERFTPTNHVEREAFEVLHNLHQLGLVKYRPDGTVQVTGTREEIMAAGLDPEAMLKSLNTAIDTAEQEVTLLKDQQNELFNEKWMLAQELAAQQQRAGSDVTFHDDVMYLCADPRGGETPLAIPGSMIREFFEQGYGSDYHLLLPDEIVNSPGALGQPTMDVQMVVGFQSDPTDTMPIRLHPVVPKHQGFVDLQ